MSRFRMLSVCSRRISLAIVGLTALIVPIFASGTPARAAYNDALYKNTNGFDTCSAKSQTMLSAWWNGTPWLDIGVYLGGSVGQSLGCYDGPAAVDRALNTGYGVTLYWYGPQLGSPCNIGSFSSYISLNTTTAYNQGVSQASAANSAAVAAGLPFGTRIFYDMEAYHANSGCRAAAKSFINGWDHQLNVNTSFWAAAYGSSCASYPSDWAGLANVPQAISPSDTTRDVGSVNGFPCLPDSQWSHDQRVGQVSQDHGTYNGYSMYIDENCADAYLPSIFPSASNSCSDVL